MGERQNGDEFAAEGVLRKKAGRGVWSGLKQCGLMGRLC